MNPRTRFAGSCKLEEMDTANDTPHHDNAHSLSSGAMTALLIFTVVGCLIGIYVGLEIGHYAHL